jgi:integrase
MPRANGPPRDRRSVRKAARAANNEGSVYRAGKYYKAALIIDGKRRFRSAVTEELAYQKLDELKLLRDQGELALTRTQSVALYCAQWLKDTKSPPHTRPHTYWLYTSRLGHVVDALGHLRLCDVTPTHIARMEAALLSQGLAAGTVRGVHSLFRAALADACRYEVLESNPALNVTAPKRETTEFSTLTREELVQLLEISRGTRWHALWTLLGTCGMRLGEALALTWGDVRGGTVKIRQTVTSGQGQGIFLGPVKTKKSRRDIPLSRTASTALKRHSAIQAEEQLKAKHWTDNQFVFPNSTGGLMHEASAHRSLQRDLGRANLPLIRPHDLRHTAATLMLEDGQQPHTVQKTLGHSNIAMTLGLYGHVTAGMLQSAADSMDRLLGAAK